MSEKQMRLGALGGRRTKMVCAVVSGDGEVLDRMETPTLTPAETVRKWSSGSPPAMWTRWASAPSARPASTPKMRATVPSSRRPSSRGEAMVFAPRSPTPSDSGDLRHGRERCLPRRSGLRLLQGARGRRLRDHRHRRGRGRHVRGQAPSRHAAPGPATCW